MAVEPGSHLGRYRIEALVGTGGMGAVYRAHDSRLERQVAIKVLQPLAEEPIARARLIQEARSASALNHPNICVVYDAGEESGQIFIAMEYIEGRSLLDLVRARVLPVEEVLRYGWQVADALAHAHERGIVHRDLKAANVIVSSRGSVKVVDFGLAKRMLGPEAETIPDRIQTQPGALAGTLYAMAPEQLRGEPVDRRTDIWALGVLLHEIAAGHPPFGGISGFEITSAILRDPPKPLPAHLPAGLRRIVERCLTKDPALRYQRIEEARGALEALVPAPVSPVARPGAAVAQPESDISSGGARVSGPTLVRAAVAAAASFVGREPELIQMEHAWQRARAGERQVVLIAGEPGIGKTRLAGEFCRRRGAEGALTLVGRCDEDALVPYQPFIEALGQYSSLLDDDSLRRQISTTGGSEIARLVPDLVRRLPDLPAGAAGDPESQRYRLFEAVNSLLVAESLRRPVVVVLDDLHWADKPTLLLLRHIARAGGPAALCILGTYRDTELGRTHPLAELLADLRRDQLATRVAVRGLALDEVVHLLSTWTGRAPAREFSQLLAEETAGNPFFIREILTHLSETGMLEQVDSGWRRERAAELGIPEGVKEVIGRRLSRLGEVCGRTLSLACVIGREFRFDVLKTLAETGEDELLDALEEATGAGVIAEVHGGPERYSFAHALIRETLYGELSTARRARLHRRIGEALEALARTQPVALADLAHHFTQAAPAGDVEKAVEYAIRAAESAASTLAHEAAARFYEMALQTLELRGASPERTAIRTDLHRRRGDALASVGQWAAAKADYLAALEATGAEQLEPRAELLLSLSVVAFWLMDIPALRRQAGEVLEAAEKLDRRDLAADASAWLARAETSDGNLARAIEIDRRALDLAGGSARVALLHAPLTLYLAGREREALELGRDAVAYARHANDATSMLYSLSHYALALAASGRYTEAQDVFDEARAFGRRFGAHPLLARAIAMSAGWHLDVFDFDGAEALQNEARELARSAAFVPPIVSAGLDLALNYARRSDPGPGPALLAQVREAMNGAKGWHAWLWSARLREAEAELALARGEWENGSEAASQVIEECRRVGRVKYEALGLLTRARALCGWGKTAAAIEDLHAAAAAARRVGDPSLVLRTLAPQLEIEGNDDLAREARAAADRIRSTLPDAVRPRFEESELVRGLPRG
jgi:predicted ATPase/predicted Ser/Thr protein kinase